ncbi:hypothetical protein [Aromatoleum petrolei]|uniref:Uncharacterized protein n=1 Tax=Aromatoleum petrolei TaxID=76116 RepID=A0ABX1MZS7_9RHOO|nr:hypothetical protein [Aromatoleum petrolei]NMF90597.1 hypothetical protein [Aromatoleum petrolei]QTQ37132.1 Uncharacterized protein ToN1_30020 [Aromatoleum petrolei]
MKNGSKLAIGAALVAGAGFLGSPDVFADVQSARVVAAEEARMKSDFARMLESTRELNKALKRVGEERKVDNSRVVQDNEARIKQAEAAAAEGKTLDARLMLEDAYLGAKLAIAELVKPATGAARPAAPAAVTDPREQKEYAARKDSTKALRDALARIAEEKNDDKGRAEVKVVDKLMADADATLAENAKRGRAILDHAYLRTKVQIERLRGGETLVRTLQFDSKGDEYRYEQDRNETYRLLIPMLVPNGSAREAQIKGTLDRAAKLRADAEAQAKRSDFDAALKTIDESTAEYQKAIRNAGVLLPG